MFEKWITLSTEFFSIQWITYRVVKSSLLPAEITAYLVSIGQLLYLAFLYRQPLLNKIYPGLTAYFDNSAVYSVLQNFLTILNVIDFLILIYWIAIYPVDSAIQGLNNQSLKINPNLKWGYKVV